MLCESHESLLRTNPNLSGVHLTDSLQHAPIQIFNLTARGSVLDQVIIHQEGTLQQPESESMLKAKAIGAITW